MYVHIVTKGMAEPKRIFQWKIICTCSKILKIDQAPVNDQGQLIAHFMLFGTLNIRNVFR